MDTRLLFPSNTLQDGSSPALGVRLRIKFSPMLPLAPEDYADLSN
jgi:hypothetical protein